MRERDASYIARSVQLQLFGLIMTMVGGVFESTVQIAGIPAMLVVILAGYAVGIVGAARQVRAEKAYIPVIATFLLAGLCTIGIQILSRSAAQTYVQQCIAVLLLYISLINAVVHYATLVHAIKKQIQGKGAPESITRDGHHWVQWMAVSTLLIFLQEMGLFRMFRPEELIGLTVQMIGVVLVFVFTLSAVIVGVRFLWKTYKFLLSNEGGSI